MKRRYSNPSLARFSAGHDPNTVYLLARNLRGEAMEVFSDRHDGTVAGIREAARFLQSGADAEIHDWSMTASQLVATDEHGRAGWVVSPNLAHISRVGTDAAAYTLGDLSRAPKKAPAKRAALKSSARKRNPDIDSDDWRFRLIEDINSWAFGSPEDMGVHRVGRYEPDVRRWAPIAKAAKVPMAKLVASAKPITAKTPYVTAELRLTTRSDLAYRMTDHLRKASGASIERYAYFREDYMAEHEE